MPSTTNFGWTTPADTDLVKDGAAAIRTLGNGVDASFVDLKGGTTGQILSKNSNTDLDFVWIANDQGDITAVTAGTGISGGGTSGAVTITNSMATEITASGDIIVGTGSGTFDNLPIGATGQVLTADTTVSPYKVKWATLSTGSMTLLSTTSISGSTTTVSISGTGYEGLRIVISDFTLSSAGNQIYVRFNSDSNNNYFKSGTLTGFAQSDQAIGSAGAQSSIYTSQQARTTQTDSIMILDILNSEQSTCHKVGHYVYKYFRINDEAGCETGGFCYASNSVISSVTLGMLTSGTFSSGEIKVYGIK